MRSRARSGCAGPTEPVAADAPLVDGYGRLRSLPLPGWRAHWRAAPSNPHTQRDKLPFSNPRVAGSNPAKRIPKTL
jgi:hypothetical protein